MTPRTAIAQLAKMIGQELESGAGPSEGALAAGPILAEAGATTEIVGRLFAEARRKRPNDRMIQAYAFMLEATLGTLRAQANGGDVGAEHAIAQVRKGLDYALPKGGVAAEVLMLVARARALIDGRLSPSIDDVMAMAEPILKHRMALTFAARADGESMEGVIGKLKTRIG